MFSLFFYGFPPDNEVSSHHMCGHVSGVRLPGHSNLPIGVNVSVRDGWFFFLFVFFVFLIVWQVIV